MKLSECKFFAKPKEYITLLTKLIGYNLQIDFAYPASGWGNILSTLFFTLAFILYVEIIYAKVDNVAGYERNEILLFFLISQFTFYTSWATWYQGIRDFPDEVNRGDFDLTLLKPVNELFYMSVSKIKLLRVFRDGIIPIVAITLIIDWSKITTTFLNLTLGIIIMILGWVCFYNLMVISVIPSVWLGQLKSLYGIIYNLYDLSTEKIPLEGFTKSFKFIFTFVLPLLFISGYSTSVITGRSFPLPTFILTLSVTIVFSQLTKFLWKLALKNYTSASS